VRNNTSKRLVAFKSEPRAENLLGGIPANATQHGLKKNSALFTSSGDFPLVLITEEEYNANKSNLTALTNTPFTRVWAFYNAGSVNETVYEISNALGGSNRLLIQNGTAMNVELRLNGIMGETVGYAASGMYNTTINMLTGDYLLFPVFKKYNSVKNEVITVYPKRTNDNSAMRTQIAFDTGTTEISLDVEDYLKNQTLSTGSAWLIIDNQCTDSGVQLQKGGVIQRTEEGIATINSGFSRQFRIDMTKLASNVYDTTASIGAYSIGPTGDLKSVASDLYDAGGAIIAAPTLQVDRIYKIVVTGSVNGSTLKITWPDSNNSPQTVDLTNFN
jgi:hypothetical protein